MNIRGLQRIELHTASRIYGPGANDRKLCRKEWLERNGITYAFLTYHVGNKHLYDYLDRKLKLWEEEATEKPDNDFPTDGRRTLSIV